jgi:hypothetical protein
MAQILAETDMTEQIDALEEDRRTVGNRIAEFFRRHSGWWKRLPLPLKAVSAPVAYTWISVRYSIQHWQRVAPVYVLGSLTGAWAAVQFGGVPQISVVLASGVGLAELLMHMAPVGQAREDDSPVVALAYRMGSRRPRSPWGRAYAVTVWAASSVWLGGMAYFDAARPWPAWGGVGALVLGGTWYASVAGARHGQWQPAEVEPVADEVDEDPTEKVRGEHLQIWNEDIASPMGALPGSELVDLTITEDSWEATVVVHRGRGTAEGVHAAVGRIASAYDIPVDTITTEAALNGSARRARISVFTRDPLQKPNYWEGPGAFDPVTGIARIGIYPDGDSVPWRFWMPGVGPRSGMVSGGTGSGKSQFLTQLMCVMATSPHFVTFFGDPQGGASVPEVQEYVSYMANSPLEIAYMLEESVEFMRDRTRRMGAMKWVDGQGRARTGVSYFDPVASGLPMLGVVMDESGSYLKAGSRQVAAAEDFVTMARKAGGFLVVANHIPNMGELGDSAKLKDALTSGNVWVGRTGGPMAGHAAFQGKFPVQPHLLPPEWADGTSTAGLAYAQVPGMRLSRMRTALVRDAFHWMSLGQVQHLQGEDAAAMSARFGAREERRRALQEGREEIMVKPDNTPVRVSAPGSVEGRAKAAVVSGTDTRDGATLEERITAAEADAARMPAGVPTTARGQILAVLVADGGVMRNAEIMAATGIGNKRTMSSSLSRLAEDGLVEKVDTGQWRALDREREQRSAVA